MDSNIVESKNLLEDLTQHNISKPNEGNQLDNFIKKYIKSELDAKKFQVYFLILFVI